MVDEESENGRVQTAHIQAITAETIGESTEYLTVHSSVNMNA